MGEVEQTRVEHARQTSAVPCAASSSLPATLLPPSSVTGDVVVLHDIYEEDRALLNVEHDPVAAVDAGFEVVLLRVNRLDTETGRGHLLDQGDRRLIARHLPLGAELQVASFPLLGPDGGQEGLFAGHGPISGPLRPSSTHRGTLERPPGSPSGSIAPRRDPPSPGRPVLASPDGETKVVPSVPESQGP